ncbi:hypothetical protein TNIN_411351 [Trichonephila inaurata madagascariensis]|uniref:Uncharacterized protein n=1 Tax=Trichonephila inaurata madagascariensis TaxID=2747483 RepID=A0A8X7CUJ8_9ARAC|nr:hypothetical protein TNIN_411351 [Trichonephila inaurata madagascariensis]
MCKVWQVAPHERLQEDATCRHCQGNHPANYSGCPKNPFNKPPPPPKVNFWEERTWIRKEMVEAEKFKSQAHCTVPAPPGNNSSEPQPSKPQLDRPKPQTQPESFSSKPTKREAWANYCRFSTDR